MIIYLLDDSKVDLMKLEHFVKQYAGEMGVETIVLAFSNPVNFLEFFEATDEKPYLVFMDIYMEGMNGIETAKKLREIGGNEVRLVFTTSSDEFAMEAFEVFADGYVKKPYRYDEFKKALSRFEGKFRSESKVITLHSIRQDMPLHVATILYAETADHKVDIHTEKGIVTASMAMKELYALLGAEPGFINCGQSYIINMARVKAVTKDTIVMDDSTEIIIPVRLRKTIVSQINDYKNSVL